MKALGLHAALRSVEESGTRMPAAMYVRVGPFVAYVRMNQPHGSLTLANVRSARRGSGKFDALLRLLARRGNGEVVIECVMNGRLRERLERDGARRLGADCTGAPTYALKPK